MTMQLPLTQNLSLYEQDYCLWIEEILENLRKGHLSEIDILHLIEEIEDMGISQKDALESNLRILLMHLLKYHYQPSKRTGSWKSTIREHRKRILKAFKKSPSLKRYFSEVFTETYQDARELAADETSLPLELFPVNCPFTVEQVLNPDYLTN